MNRIAAFATVLLAACSHNDQGISEQLTREFARSDQLVIDLAALGPTGWDKVCVLSPYSNNVRTREVLGFPWNAEGKTNIAVSDTINVLVFVRKQEVVAYAEHPRGAGDLSALSPPCLSRAQARVVRRAGSNGWVFLVAQNAA